jgi:hypothetical protein
MERGEGKPETLDFLGFAHFYTRSRKWGSLVIGCKTIKKRTVRQLQAIKMELRKLMTTQSRRRSTLLHLLRHSNA